MSPPSSDRSTRWWDIPVKEPSIRDRSPSESILLLTHQILNDFAFIFKDWHHSLHLWTNCLGSKFGWDEPLHSGLDRGVDRRLGGIDKVRIEDTDDGVLTLEGVDELIFGIAAIHRDDLDVRGEMRLGAFPGQDGEVESRVLVNGGADGGTDVPAGLSSIRRRL